MQRQTTIANANTVTRKWYVIDATNLPLGRLASEVARYLTGKKKAIYTPNVDCGDYVIIINAEKAVLTGKKLTQKYYYRHSGYVGGLKETQYSRLMATKPELAMKLAVKGMLPKNSVGRWSLGRMKVYAGAEHKHNAQKPEFWTAE